jgi:hypothetical protein
MVMAVMSVMCALTRSRLSQLFGHFLDRDFEKSNTDHLGIALYIESLVKLLQFRVKEFRLGAKALPHFVPIGTRNKVFQEFTNAQ